LYGSLYSVSFEEVGECAMQFLPLSKSAFAINSRTGSAFAPESDPAYRLPAALVPAAGSQQYWMKLGIVSALSTLQCSFDASPFTTAAKPAALYLTAIDPDANGLDGLNLDAFSSITYGTNDGKAGSPAGLIAKANSAYVPMGRGNDKAYKGDLALNRAVMHAPNLLAGPEKLGTLAAGVKNNLLVANGGNWTPYQGEATGNALTAWNTGNEFTGFTFPRGFYEELGNNPFIAKFNNAATFTDSGFVLNFAPQITEPNRVISASFWIACKGPVAGKTPKTRVYLGDSSGNNVYDTSEYVAPLVWRRIRWVGNRNSTGVYNKFNASLYDLATTGAFYIAGLMVNWDDAAPYNPNNGPTIKGTLYLDGQTTQATVGAAGTAATLPTKPSLYETVYVNGVKYVRPLYLPS